MGENRSVLTALGAILGLVLFIYIILQGVGYYRAGVVEFDEMQRQAGEPILLSETLHETGEITGTTEITESITETVAVAEAAAVTDTATVAETEEVTATDDAAPAEVAVTDTASVTATAAMTDTAPVTTTAVATETSAPADTVATDEGDVAATETVTDVAAVDESPVVTATEGTTETEPVVEAPAEAAPAEEPAAEEPEPPAEAVVMAVPAPEDVAPIFTKAGCIGCHVIPDIPGALGAIGPNLSEIGVVAATRIDGYTAEEYIYESLLEPNAFIAPECPTGPCLPGLMVQNLGEILTPEELDMVVAYLMTMGVE